MFFIKVDDTIFTLFTLMTQCCNWTTKNKKHWDKNVKTGLATLCVHFLVNHPVNCKCTRALRSTYLGWWSVIAWEQAASVSTSTSNYLVTKCVSDNSHDGMWCDSAVCSTGGWKLSVRCSLILNVPLIQICVFQCCMILLILLENWQRLCVILGKYSFTFFYIIERS